VLILTAARALVGDPRDCWVVEYILDDVEAGRQTGCRTVLIDNGKETDWRPGQDREPHHRAADLAAAARAILVAESREGANAGACA
jgi:beta-phosphoglucomutase-like phosphatase (HAD superfamily)